MKASGIQPTTPQYRATTSKAGYRQPEQTTLRMGHLRNDLIQHRDSTRGAHRHAFNLNLQNAHLTDLHRHDPTFKRYARRLLESVAVRSTSPTAPTSNIPTSAGPLPRARTRHAPSRYPSRITSTSK